MPSLPMSDNSTAIFRRARDFLIEHRCDYERAWRDFAWPRLETFNWALDWFDEIARRNDRTALRIVGDKGLDECISFDDLRRRSNSLAQHLRELGLRRGDRILVMLGNVPRLWEFMLAAIKLGCPIVPTTTLMMPVDLRDRVDRGAVRAVVTEPMYAERFDGAGGALLRMLTHGSMAGWQTLPAASCGLEEFDREGATAATDPLLLYFTSGTTAKPKLVVHTQVSYPIGHLSTMYWLGLKPGDVHLNLSSPGWAKHAWSSFFAPWNAEATIVMQQTGRFDAAQLLQEIARCEVTSFCAPPTVWRSLIQLPLAATQVKLRELLSAGEPLNPEVINHVRKVWGLTIRDGYGQTETTLQIGNFPGQPVKIGSMGKPAPGYRIHLLNTDGVRTDEGEISVSLAEQPLPVMPGYLDDPERTQAVMSHGHYHTGDIASRDADGYFTYVGRNDDVFKSSDYRISPFELESLLIEHEAVAEAAVVPSPDAKRLSVPKAFIVLAKGHAPSRETAHSILRFVRMRSSPFKRIRRIEFADLPKTLSGKIRRVELRTSELGRPAGARRAFEYWEEDLPELSKTT
jgi:acetyl-CoA synthetase